MRPARRACLAQLWGLLHGGGAGLALWGAQDTAFAAAIDAVHPGRALRFPRDHGAHAHSRIEWWYVTGWLTPDGTAQGPMSGFQVTFFRMRTGLGPDMAGRFVPRHLLFAHAAVTDLASRRHRHGQRIARWSGDPQPALAQRALMSHADVRLGDWSLAQETPALASASPWTAHVREHDFTLAIRLVPTQKLLLQGQAGYSRKGPQVRQASHYYSLPQLSVSAQLSLDAAPARALRGRAWLDHEWSDELLHPHAVGWDWVGLNLFDGSALTVFQLRRADGTAIWAGGSLRRTGTESVRDFAPAEVRFAPLSRWKSASTGADYPVEWSVDCPAGTVRVRALLSAQELDSRSSTGTVYWEGLSEALDGQGQRIGLGYLEMTGYAGRLAL